MTSSDTRCWCQVQKPCSGRQDCPYQGWHCDFCGLPINPIPAALEQVENQVGGALRRLGGMEPEKEISIKYDVGKNPLGNILVNGIEYAPVEKPKPEKEI